MRLLILGYSSIVERRVIPAAAKVEAIAQISIASKSRPQPEGWPKQGRFFNDYAAALRDSDSDLVYLSLPNAMHEHWVMAALAAGKHVVVDKPAMMTLAGSERAVDEARRVNRAVAEATVFGHHPQFESLAAFVAEHGPLTQAAAQFIIPPLPIGNFRNHRELGGGCLLDMGPYAAATTRILGGGAASEITALAGGRHPETGVDMGFSVLARLGNGGAFSGHFSFEGEYQNRLLVVGHSGSVLIERVFTPPADHQMEWRRRVRNVDDVVTFEPADTFARFLAAVASAIDGGDHESFHRDLLSDARCRDMIATALASQNPAHQRV
ncbi:Gfo/Idh/MocA family protein [Bradyrhizobium sp. AUGA SZCCT0283]|uniref:Gfo/Idh/MocA family protein n=1 Tax=Bradyrhizobium sp. AUGA SZCCT0283 TaxID=2807671 RepID=UPI001BA83074|nr:Gfo/Idh/MocA family oxidoreductase [Bradyrhizobium sp. AUGA SZCCT0283]MBR1277675.1 Gfo/Idh/MocA family oxidoreductase [Bradyrhizobium sp. AUGA SZCCT0283]